MPLINGKPWFLVKIIQMWCHIMLDLKERWLRKHKHVWDWEWFLWVKECYRWNYFMLYERTRIYRLRNECISADKENLCNNDSSAHCKSGRLDNLCTRFVIMLPIRSLSYEKENVDRKFKIWITNNWVLLQDRSVFKNYCF